MLRLLFMVFMILQAAGSFAEELPENNVFRLMDEELTCITGSDRHTDPAECISCLRIGQVGIGSKLEEIESEYDQILSSLPLNKNTFRNVYLVDQEGEALTYLILTYRDSLAVSVQLTGGIYQKDLVFSDIGLGDSSEKVREILGEPVDIKPVPEINGKMWGYRPYTFNFEFVNGLVYSIAVWKP